MTIQLGKVILVFYKKQHKKYFPFACILYQSSFSVLTIVAALQTEFYLEHDLVPLVIRETGVSFPVTLDQHFVILHQRVVFLKKY